MTLARRSFLTGIGAIVCAPAIVRASSLMPIKVVKPEIIHASQWTDAVMLNRYGNVVFSYQIIAEMTPSLTAGREQLFDVNFKKLDGSPWP